MNTVETPVSAARIAAAHIVKACPTLRGMDIDEVERAILKADLAFTQALLATPEHPIAELERAVIESAVEWNAVPLDGSSSAQDAAESNLGAAVKALLKARNG